MARLLYVFVFNVYMVVSLGLFQVSLGEENYWLKLLLICPVSIGFAYLGLSIFDNKRRIAKLEEANSTPTIRE